MLRLLALTAWTVTNQSARAAFDGKKVLFLAVNDLRPKLRCCGQTHVKTPNIDWLAACGMRDDCRVCAASRYLTVNNPRAAL